MHMLPITDIAVFDDSTNRAYIVKACTHQDALAVTPKGFSRAMDLEAAKAWGYMDKVIVVDELDAAEGEAS